MVVLFLGTGVCHSFGKAKKKRRKRRRNRGKQPTKCIKHTLEHKHIEGSCRKLPSGFLLPLQLYLPCLCVLVYF